MKDEVPDERLATKAFEDAVAEIQIRRKHQQDTRYLEGVAAALGWMLGEYADNPME